MKSKIYHLYIHFPFCNSKCKYCDFYSIVDTDLINRYINSLIDDIKNSIEIYDFSSLKTIYIGGGSPGNYLDQLLPVIKEIERTYRVVDELTIEFNPVFDFIKNEEMLSNLKEMNVNRISLGIQSFTNKALEFAGRKMQDNDRMFEILDVLSKYFCNISIDLISNLPFTDLNNDKLSLYNLINNFEAIKHISLYDLSIEKGTKFYTYLNNRQIIINETLDMKYKNDISSLISSAGFKKYEISNYAKDNYQSLHNIGYWKYNNYLGLGASAHSTYDGIRIENSRSVINYINRENYFKKYKLSLKEEIQEYLLMGLRLKKGISNIEFSSKFKMEINSIFEKSIQKYKKNIFLKTENHKILTTDRGELFLNQILIDMFIDLDNIF